MHILRSIDLMVVGIVAIVLISLSISEPMDAELLFHYNFESETLKDASGNKNVGEIRGDAQQVNSRVKIGMGLKFDGVDDYIFLCEQKEGPLIFTHEPFTEKSVAMWIKADDVNTEQTLFDEGGAKAGYAIRVNAENLRFSVRNESTEITATAGYVDTDWHHIAGVFNKGELCLYIDGQEVATENAPYKEVDVHTDQAAIGTTFDADAFGHNNNDEIPWYFFQGIIDEIYYYSNALTDKEIHNFYRSAAMEPSEKLTTVWGWIKVQY